MPITEQTPTSLTVQEAALREIDANEDGGFVPNTDMKGEDMDAWALTDARVMSFVPTAKPDEARAFYEGTLGLPFQSADEFALTFSVGQAQTLRVQRVAELTPQPFTVFGWQVEDIEDAVTRLAERGVAFAVYGFPGQDARGICTFPNGDKVAWFQDPDGNTLSLAQLVGAELPGQ